MFGGLPDLRLDDDQFRSLVLQILPQMPRGQLQGLRTEVAKLALELGLYPTQNHGRSINTFGPQDATPVFGSHYTTLSDRDFGRLANTVEDLIADRILRRGLGDGMNNDLPWFHVTAHGEKMLSGEQPSPLDRDAYLTKLNTEIPEIDPIIMTYMEESLATFRSGCTLSSTVTLGCASERALIVLIDACRNALPPTLRGNFEKKTDGQMIKRQFDEFRRLFDDHLVKAMPRHLREDIDVQLNAIFSIIRHQRNEVGHPTGAQINREQAQANLTVFLTYIRKVYDLIRWLKLNPLV